MQNVFQRRVVLCPFDGCWGFIDGTLLKTCRPSVGQRAVYNGHKKQHGLKYQAVTTPDGLIVSLSEAFAGRAHDMTMFHESEMNNLLDSLPNDPDPTKRLHIFRDQGYSNSLNVVTPYRGLNLTPAQVDFNRTMSSIREPVEWAFKDIDQQWAFIDFKKNLNLLLQPVGKYYLVAAFLWNCLCCCNGSQTYQYFDCQPPSLREYLNMQ